MEVNWVTLHTCTDIKYFMRCVVVDVSHYCKNEWDLKHAKSTNSMLFCSNYSIRYSKCDAFVYLLVNFRKNLVSSSWWHCQLPCLNMMFVWTNRAPPETTLSPPIVSNTQLFWWQKRRINRHFQPKSMLQKPTNASSRAFLSPIIDWNLYEIIGCFPCIFATLHNDNKHCTWIAYWWWWEHNASNQSWICAHHSGDTFFP